MNNKWYLKLAAGLLALSVMTACAGNDEEGQQEDQGVGQEEEQGGTDIENGGQENGDMGMDEDVGTDTDVGTNNGADTQTDNGVGTDTGTTGEQPGENTPGTDPMEDEEEQK